MKTILKNKIPIETYNLKTINNLNKITYLTTLF